MFKRFSVISVFFAALVLALPLPSRADDVSGKIGISGIAQAGFPLGTEPVRRQGDPGTVLGGMVRYGLAKHWGLGVSYENLDLQHGVRVEPITLQGLYYCMPDKRWSPVTLLGLGAAATNPNGRYNNLSAKLGAGMEYFLTPQASLGGLLTYHYVSETGDAPHQVHALGVGLLASYFFGGEHTAKVAEAPKAIAPPPPPAPVTPSLTLTPSEATLGPAQTQQFAASVANASNTGVDWSYAPALGTLSNAGLYTAPTEIQLSETVHVTAKSLADPSKSASSMVKLVPPATAAQKVSIELHVLFDTAKDVVKPEYKAEIQRVADFMKSYPSSRAEIEGHTDSMGDAAMNMGLSQRRADAVRNYLIQQFGVDAMRLSAKGYGETQPVADNKTVDGRAKNRRVVATLSASK